MRMFHDDDVSMAPLEDKKVAIVGYGIQGRAHALNLRDSGVDVVVGAREGRPSWKRAEEDGFSPVPTPEAAAQAAVIALLTQDDVQPRVYEEQIRDHLDEGDTLVFAHGFNIHFNQIVPPPEVDVVLVAPKGPGSLVRQTFVEGKGVPCLVGVHQDHTGNAMKIALAYAKGIGGGRAGILESSFAEETETDLFGEQAVLCGGVSALIKAAFETLVEAGYQPEVAYFECLHELKLITDMINYAGIQGMRKRVSDTAEYGDLTRGPRVIDDHVRENLKSILEEIRSGVFAREWILENRAGRPVFNALRKRDERHLIEVVGREMRAMMSWMKSEASTPTKD